MELIFNFGSEYIYGLAIDSSDVIFVANSKSNSIDGVFFEEEKWVRKRGETIDNMKEVRGLTFENGVLYIGCCNKILKKTHDGKITPYVDDDDIKYPYGLCFDDNGTLYVADESRHLIKTISNGKTTYLCGSGVQAFADGKGAEASFARPVAIAFNKSSRLFYIADLANKRIRTMTLEGDVKTLCEYFYIQHLVLDGAGTIYVSTVGNSKDIRPGVFKVNPSSGEITYIAVHSQRFDAFGMAFNSKGDLFISCNDGKLFLIKDCTQFPPNPVISPNTAPITPKHSLSQSYESLQTSGI